MIHLQRKLSSLCPLILARTEDASHNNFPSVCNLCLQGPYESLGQELDYKYKEPSYCLLACVKRDSQVSEKIQIYGAKHHYAQNITASVVKVFSTDWSSSSKEYLLHEEGPKTTERIKGPKDRESYLHSSNSVSRLCVLLASKVVRTLIMTALSKIA